jgi:hypothetical protein
MDVGFDEVENQLTMVYIVCLVFFLHLFVTSVGTEMVSLLFKLHLEIQELRKK